jgi:hypothetical protein
VCDALGTGVTSRCNDLTSDSQNCGACGHTCAAGEGCQNSVCVGSCGGIAADAGVGPGGGPDAGTGGGGGPDAGIGCVSTGCTSCGQKVDNCGNPIDCAPCSGGDAGGGCVSTGCTACGQKVDNCGNPIDCAPCGGADAGAGCTSNGCTSCGLKVDSCGNPIDCAPCPPDAGVP